MTAALQLNPPLPMTCPKGEGFAHFLIDYGPKSDLYWTIFITETGEIWTFANKHVRASKNITLGRTLAKPVPTRSRFDRGDCECAERCAACMPLLRCITCGEPVTPDPVTGTTCACAEPRRYQPPQL